jgi:hypothetical protein
MRPRIVPAGWRFRHVATAILMLLAVCDGDATRPLVDAPYADLAARPQLYTSGGSSGSIQIGIPGDNGPPTYGGVAAIDLVSASRFDFIQITVTGTVTSSDSGNCDPPVGPTGTWDAFGAPGGGLRVHISTSPSIGGIPTAGQGTGTMVANKGVNSDVTLVT